MTLAAEASGGILAWVFSKEPIAIGIFVAYFGLIAAVSYLVYLSISDGVKLEDLFSGRPFLFLRVAVGALGCTWYCEP
jgi:alpha-1,2-mannosyltransferase